jgi:hypothetical protein
MYDAIMQELGLPLGDSGDWPDGIISHAAGSTPDGTWVVVDVWESQRPLTSSWPAVSGRRLRRLAGCRSRT